jgi:fatty acid desaturase
MPRETRYALAVIAGVYSLIIALAIVAHDSWALWLATLPIIGGLQNHLLLLHHEGAHGLLHPQRRVNDFITNIFCGFPFLELLRPYREFHFAHHRHVTSDQDPELPFYHQQGYFFEPLSRVQTLRQAFLDLSGYHWLQFFFAFLFSLELDAHFFTRNDRSSIAVFALLPLLLLIPGFGSGVLWFWLIPQITITFYFAKRRGFREHNKRVDSLDACTNNVNGNILERFFLFPLNSDQHLDHHLNPQLRWFEYPR